MLNNLAELQIFGFTAAIVCFIISVAFMFLVRKYPSPQEAKKTIFIALAFMIVAFICLMCFLFSARSSWIPVCPTCDKEFGRDTTYEYCPWCGGEIYFPQEHIDDPGTSGDEEVCAICKKSFPEAYDFCPHCGSSRIHINTEVSHVRAS